MNEFERKKTTTAVSAEGNKVSLACLLVVGICWFMVNQSGWLALIKASQAGGMHVGLLCCCAVKEMVTLK